MTDKQLVVYVDLEGAPHLVGRLWARSRKGRESATFEYDRSWTIKMADALRQYGAKPVEDCAQLWRRIVFSILIANTDDHLCNHGFLYDPAGGWRLAPAYDINPVPLDIKPRILTTAIDETDGTGSLDLVLSTAPHYGLESPKARAIADEVSVSVKGWRNVAKALKLSSAEIDRMASAFVVA